VVEGPFVPADGIVAGRTLIVEITAMRIFILMAGNTSGIGIAKCLRLMAVLALCFTMMSEQRKRTEVVVEKDRVLPVDFGMAAFALSAKGLLVYVVLDVARLTACIECYLENWINMAIVTSWLKVAADQSVSSITIVIERRFRPGAVVVAGVALVAAMSVMFVIFQMTRYAVHAHRVLERFL
jgi:hypothetical protein